LIVAVELLGGIATALVDRQPGSIAVSLFLLELHEELVTRVLFVEGVPQGLARERVVNCSSWRLLLGLVHLSLTASLELLGAATSGPSLNTSPLEDGAALSLEIVDELRLLASDSSLGMSDLTDALDEGALHVGDTAVDTATLTSCRTKRFD